MKKRSHTSGPKQRKAFFDNYKAAVLLAMVLFFSLFANSQTIDTTRTRQNILANPGYNYIALEVYKGLVVPRDTIRLAQKDSGAIAYKNGRYWQYTGSYWDTLRAAIGGGAGGGTTNLSKSYTSTSVTVSPSGGGTAVALDPATTSLAGIMTAANKRSIDSAITKIVPINDSVTNYYNSLGVVVKSDTSKAFDFVLPLKVTGQSAKLDYDTNSLRIISNKLAAKITTVKNIGELRTLPSYDTSMIYRLIQNKIIGDFYFVSGCSDGDDSAMNISVTGGCLKRYTAGIVRPEYFGATNNDLTDDSYAFQKMWNWIGANAGVDKREEYTVLFTGKYYQNTTVTLPKFLYNQGGWPTVRVSGYGATIVLTGAITGMKRVPANMNEAIFDSQNMIGNSRWTFEGLTFLGDQTTGQKALEVGALYSANIKDNYFSALDTGIVARFILGSVIMNNQFINNKSVGMVLSHGNWTAANESNAAFNANYVNKNRIYCGNGSHTAILMEAGDGNDISNTIIEGAKPRYSIVVDSRSSSVVNGNHIRTMWFESNGGVYANNTAMKLSVNGIMTIDGIQNDSPDTLIDWSGSAAGADISLDNVEYWNFSAGTWFKGTPASGMIFRVGRIYGTLTENMFSASKYLDGIPADVFTLYGYQTSAGGYGIASTSQISLKPGINLANGSKLLSIFGNPKPSADNTFDLGAGSLRWATTYSNKILAGLASEDGTGARVQSAGSMSVADGERVTNPDGSARIAFSSNGLQIQYLSGTYATLKLDPSLTYTHGGVTRFGVSNTGEVWINPAGIADLGNYTLQNTGGLYQQGAFRLGGTVTATSPLFLLAKLSDSSVAEIAFPGGTSTFLAADGTFQSPPGGGLSGLSVNAIQKATSSTTLGPSTVNDDGVNTSFTAGVAYSSTQVVTTGTSSTIGNGIFTYEFDPASVIASYTVTMPAAPADGSRVTITTGKTIAAGSPTITTLTVSPNSGQTIFGALTLTALNSGDFAEYRYESSNTTWYRIR